MAKAKLSQSCVEVLMPFTLLAPAVPVGAGSSQYLVEALCRFESKVRLTQSVVEVLMTESESQSAAPEDVDVGVRVYGHAT